MCKNVSHPTHNVEVLFDAFEAAKFLAKVNNCPVEAIINTSIMSSFANEHNSLLDYDAKSRKGLISNSNRSNKTMIKSFNRIRKKIRPYESGMKCVCCGEDTCSHE